MRKLMSVLTCVMVAAIVSPLIQGCCMPATQNPIAAATAAAKVLGAVQGFQDASTTEEMVDAVGDMAETISELSTSEIASVVNLVAGQDWSLEDAQAVKDLAAQVDEEAIDALAEIDLTQLEPDADEVIAVLDEVGITVTDTQVELLTGIIDELANIDVNDLGGLLSGFGGA